MQKGLMTLKELLQGDRIFRVPDYQRNYAWTPKQVRDLWEDLFYLDMGKRHYFGTTVLKETEEVYKHGLKSFSVYEVIDGQQRLTTTIILLRELLSRIERIGGEEHEEQLADLRKDYIRYDGVYKVQLLGDDQAFFENYVIENETFPDEYLTPSRRRLAAAKSFIDERLAGLEDELSPQDLLRVSNDLLAKTEQLELMVYPTDDESDAILIFETVNDRGKPLSDLEKTKSFLMRMLYLAHDEDASAMWRKTQERFADIYRYLDEISNSEAEDDVREDDIQRYHFALYETPDKRHYTRYLDFLKNKCREMYRGPRADLLEYVPDYVRELESAFFTVKEIVNFETSKEIGDLLRRLYALERVANFYPLLIASWMRYRNEGSVLKKIVDVLETYAVRVYVIRQRRADTGIGQLYRLGHQLHHHEITEEELMEELLSLIRSYAPDSSVRSYMEANDFYETRTSRDIKYILYRYETHLRRAEREALNLDLKQIMSPEFEIEHIWSRHPSEPLSEEEQREHEETKDRLGNLALAAKGWNASLGNKTFAEKRKRYVDSLLRVQRVLADSPRSVWRAPEIESRTQRIINFCLDEWSV